jgi:dihydrofolate reductase
MKTVYYTATSLDGYIATEDDSLDWLLSLGDVSDSSYLFFVAQVGALAMGSATYEWLMREADHIHREAGSAWPYSQPAWVFTHRSLPVLAGANVQFVQGDVRPVHAAMARAAGGQNIWIVGGGDLAGQFHNAGLLDEAIVQVAPVTLGTGKPLFPRQGTGAPWQLVSARHMDKGFVELHYRLPGRT